MNRSQIYSLYSVILATGAMIVKGKEDNMVILCCICLLLSIYNGWKETE